MSEFGDKGPGNDIVDFTTAREAKYFDIGQELLARGAYIGRLGLVELGFATAYNEVTQQYLDNTSVFVADIDPSAKFPEGSQMTITREPGIPSRRPEAWRRVMLVHPMQLEHNFITLKEALHGTCNNPPDDAVISRAAQLWAVFSQMAGVASEAAYVVNHHNGKYITGFNGHSGHYNAQEFISSAYKETHPGRGINVHQDTLKLRHGLGLYLLGALLRDERLVANAENAENVTAAIIRHETDTFAQRVASPLLEARAYPHLLNALEARFSSLVTPAEVSRPDYGGFFIIQGDLNDNR